jgi:hypothetical protein
MMIEAAVLQIEPNMSPRFIANEFEALSGHFDCDDSV